MSKNIIKKIKSIELKPMSDGNLKYYIGTNAKILSYIDLCKYDDISQLLRNINDFFVLLYNHTRDEGHWVCLIKRENTIEYFDPLGYDVDYLLKDTNKNLNGIKKNHLKNLLNKCVENVIENKVKFQEQEDDIQTCGRHVCYRIFQANKGRNLVEYYKILTNFKNISNLTYDEIVSMLINKNINV